MPSTEEQVKSVILKHKGSARKQQIARELKMGLDYIDLICRKCNAGFIRNRRNCRMQLCFG